MSCYSIRYIIALMNATVCLQSLSQCLSQLLLLLLLFTKLSKRLAKAEAELQALRMAQLRMENVAATKTATQNAC